jgi:hypothetical protein
VFCVEKSNQVLTLKSISFTYSRDWFSNYPCSSLRDLVAPRLIGGILGHASGRDRSKMEGWLNDIRAGLGEFADVLSDYGIDSEADLRILTPQDHENIESALRHRQPPPKPLHMRLIMDNMKFFMAKSTTQRVPVVGELTHY